ncbi:MAG: hypothetical protein HKN48_09660 [Flavobacteriaceae bacterium]|nr:hypothetical protein [Flavobacteriaceae bacterium]
MKYRRLTKEQFEELHSEFATFLATQSITSEEWEHIKEKKPEVAEDELDVFSDLIWEGVLSKAKFLQNVSPQQLFLFKISEETIDLILVKINAEGINITSKMGFKWLQENIEDDSVELYEASKNYGEDKNLDIFKLIEQGAEICSGDLYETFRKLIS